MRHPHVIVNPEADGFERGKSAVHPPQLLAPGGILRTGQRDTLAAIDPDRPPKLETVSQVAALPAKVAEPNRPEHVQRWRNAAGAQPLEERPQELDHPLILGVSSHPGRSFIGVGHHRHHLVGLRAAQHHPNRFLFRGEIARIQTEAEMIANAMVSGFGHGCISKRQVETPSYGSCRNLFTCL